MTRVFLRWLLASLLVLDGVGAVMSLARIVSARMPDDGLTIAFMAARLIAGSLSLIAGWLVGARRPQARAIAIVALVASAILATVDAATSGWWLVAAVTWIYAAGWIAVLVFIV